MTCHGIDTSVGPSVLSSDATSHAIELVTLRGANSCCTGRAIQIDTPTNVQENKLKLKKRTKFAEGR